jgi:hypothetical protein
VLIIFNPYQVFYIINGSWVITQNLQFYHVLFLVTVAMLVTLPILELLSFFHRTF